MGIIDMIEMMENANLIRETEIKRGQDDEGKNSLLSEVIKLCLHHLLKMLIALGLGGIFIFSTIIFPLIYDAMFYWADIWKDSITEHISFGMSILSLFLYCGLPFMVSYFLIYGIIGTILFLFFNPKRKPFIEYTFSWTKKKLNFLDIAFLMLSCSLAFLYNIFFPLIVDTELRAIVIKAAEQKAILPIWLGVLKYYIMTVVVFGGIIIGILGLFAGIVYGINKVLSLIFKVIS